MFNIGDIVTEEGYDHAFTYVIEKLFEGKSNHFWLKRMGTRGPESVERRWDELRMVTPVGAPDEIADFFVA